MPDDGVDLGATGTDRLQARVGVLLLGAVALNGWSCWATLVLGLLLTGVGGWAFENPAALHTAAKWTQTSSPTTSCLAGVSSASPSCSAWC